MSFLEQFISEIAVEGVYYLFKWISIGVKWVFYLGKRSIDDIKKENWNRLIGFWTFAIALSIIVYFLN